MDAKELEETILLLQGYQAKLGAIFRRVIGAYGGNAPSVHAMHEAESAVAEAIGELHKLQQGPPARTAR
jgi:hypothetical protein